MHRRHITEDQQPSIGVCVCVCICLISLYDLFPLPTESNCTYFKFFTSGENAVMFKKTTNKSETLYFPLHIQIHTNSYSAATINKDVHWAAQRTMMVVFACFSPLSSAATHFPKQIISYQTD